MAPCRVRRFRRGQAIVAPPAILARRDALYRVGVADSAGVIGAIVAALCCAGTPLIVGALSAVGLSFLRKDAILWPVMLVSLAVALWGFWTGFRRSKQIGPLLLSVAGAVSLASAVILVHGFPAMQMIYGGGIVLVLATFWNVVARRT